MHGARRVILVSALTACLAAAADSDRLAAQTAPSPPENRNFDARIAYNARYTPPAANDTFASDLAAFRATMPDAAVTLDSATGVVRSLYSRGGYLTDANTRNSATDVALAYVGEHLGVLGLQTADLDDYETTDVVQDRATGATHVYLRQRYRGLPLYNGQLQVNVNRDGRILSVNNAFHPGLANAVNAITPAIAADAAVEGLARHLRIPNVPTPRITSNPSGDQQVTPLEAPGLSTEPVQAKLMWLTIRRDDVRLVWNYQVATSDGQHVYDVNVDAVTGNLWTRFDWVASDSYKVYQLPAESPNHAAPAPPADGRVTLTNPANATASPYGWHDTNGVAGAEYTIMRGNNVHAYEDSAHANVPPASQPDCGMAVDCSFAIDLNAEPPAYTSATVANLFYLNNTIHDIQYQYGFTEEGGNFQVNNYGHGGIGNDDVRAEAQDGGGVNNANFFTPPDGQRPRMQMYLFNLTMPKRDGDFDSGIVVHEYGHGISNRLVGGPSNTSCLSNAQEPGEGLSDWWALAYTARVGDTGPLARGMGTYVLGQPITGAGIRRAPYSTNSAVNNYTYATVGTSSEVHDLGEVWTEVAWRMYWALVDKYGFDANLYNALGNAGNQRAMLYVNAGLHNTVCSPAFTDVRDGIIQAATDNHGGQDVCLLWTTFAAFGLGVDAYSGGSNGNGLNPVNGFNYPISCGGTPALPSFVVQPTSVEESEGYATEFTSVAAGNPAPTNQWQVSTNGGTTWSNLSNSSTYSGVTTGTLAVSNIPLSFNGYEYRSVAQNSSGLATSNVATLTLAHSSYDAALKAPKCGPAATSCSSGSLLRGRDGIFGGGAEPNQPNTITACADGTFGGFHFDESIDRLRVSRVNGTTLVAGKTAKIEATVWVWGTPDDQLDLYYASNADAPDWTFLTTIIPPAKGLQTLSTTYTLPTGARQAIRANFRYLGSAASCTTGDYDDHDDLIFTVVGAFTDDPLTAGIATIKAAHITELRTRVNVARAAWGLNAAAWTNDPIVPQSTAALANHIQQLRDALNAAYDAAGKPRPTYQDDPLVAGSVIKTIHITQLRDALTALE